MEKKGKKNMDKQPSQTPLPNPLPPLPPGDKFRPWL